MTILAVLPARAWWCAKSAPLHQWCPSQITARIQTSRHDWFHWLWNQKEIPKIFRDFFPLRPILAVWLKCRFFSCDKTYKAVTAGRTVTKVIHFNSSCQHRLTGIIIPIPKNPTVSSLSLLLISGLILSANLLLSTDFEVKQLKSIFLLCFQCLISNEAAWAKFRIHKVSLWKQREWIIFENPRWESGLSRWFWYCLRFYPRLGKCSFGILAHSHLMDQFVLDAWRRLFLDR